MMDSMNSAQAFGHGLDRIQDRIMTRFDADGSGDITIAEAGDFGQMAQQFTKIDANDDGLLSAREIRDQLAAGAIYGDISAGMERMNAVAAWMQMDQENQAVEAFDQMDLDSDGALSDTEITTAFTTQQAADEAAAAALREAKLAEMARMDTDMDGALSVAELENELQLRFENRAVAEFDRIDTDGDGMLSDMELANEVAAQLATQNAADDTTAPVTDDAPDVAMGTSPDTGAGTDADMGDGTDMAAVDDMAPVDDMAAPMDDTVMSDGDMATAPPATEPAMEPAVEPTAMSLIENVFETMIDDNGFQVGVDRLATMTQSLYTEAQDILMDSLAELGADNEADAA